MKALLLLALLMPALAFAAGENTRMWTNKEGKSFEGDYVAHTKNTVTIQRTKDRKLFTVKLADLVEADNKFVASKKVEKKEKDGLAEEAAQRQIPMKVSVNFSHHWNVTFAMSQCSSLEPTKLPGTFYIRKNLTGRGEYLKGQLTLVKFMDHYINGTRMRAPVYDIYGVRKGSERQIRNAKQ